MIHYRLSLYLLAAPALPHRAVGVFHFAGEASRVAQGTREQTFAHVRTQGGQGLGIVS